MSTRTFPRRTDTGPSPIEEPEQDLLPGIPNDITLDFISPKLPWRTFYILSSVGRAWRRAIRSRKVYDARLRSKATEAVVVINNFRLYDEFRAIGLYSVRDKSVSVLPSIPNVPTGIPVSCLSVAMDGKIYVFGGGWNDRYVTCHACDEVYVMDLAGQRQWQQCKSMAFPRRNFGAGVLDGKIYVFGGDDRERRPVRTSEVYDPESNSWDPIKSMVPWRFCHQVTAMGEELFLHGGRTSDRKKPKVFDCKGAKVVHAYHPEKDECRELHPFEGVDRKDPYRSKSLFVSQGQLHLMTRKGIDVYDMEKKLWTPRHSFSCREIPHALHSAWCTLDADNELVTLLMHHHGNDLFHCGIGFGGEQETIALQKVECSHKIGYYPSICLIRL